MEFKRYLKDRIGFIFAAAAAFGLSFLLLHAFHVPNTLIILVMAVFLAFAVFTLLWDFFKKHSFYDLLSRNISVLDKKNLTAEIVEEPDFYECQILYDTIYEMGKSMTEQISEAQQSVNDFKEYVEMWVHEAKLPVASLLLKTYNNSSEESRQIRKQLQRLDGYTDQILYYTRSEVAEKDFLIRSCQLGKVFSAAASKMREELQEYGFDVQTHGLNLSVMTDSKWLEFILLQLISNSIKYRSEEKDRKLEVYAEENRKLVFLHIRDNGLGISASDLPRIFEKSFTGENGRAREKSTGMGLYIARNLCRKLGHVISAESVQGEYTDFTITFSQNDHYRP